MGRRSGGPDDFWDIHEVEIAWKACGFSSGLVDNKPGQRGTLRVSELIVQTH